MLQKDQCFTYICIYYINLTKEGQGKMASVLFDWLLISLLANGVEQEKEMFQVALYCGGSGALNSMSWGKHLDVSGLWFP